VGTVALGTTLVVLTSGDDRKLAETLSHLTADGAQVVVVYADPRSFDPFTPITRADEHSLMESFFGAKTVPFVLTASAGSSLRLESAQDARYFE
jgi:hypothetical protein